MNDNSDVTEACKPKSDQLNAEVLIGESITVRIRDQNVDVTRDQQKVWIYYEGDDGKPWKPCKTMLACLKAGWGKYASAWVGKEVTLYNKPEVEYGGKQVGGVRISHMSHLDKKLVLSLNEKRGGKKQTITIQPLITQDAPKIDVDAANESVRAAALNGKAAFVIWWKSNVGLRDAVAPIMDEIKATVAEADAAKNQGDDDDLPPI
jgi:hypothetical protein